MKRARRTPKPEPLCELCGHAEHLHDEGSFCARCGATCGLPAADVAAAAAAAFDNVAMNRQIERQGTYERLAKDAGADPGQAVVLCADGSVRLLERAVINQPRPLPEPLADGTKIDVNNYEALWLTYDERNYNERTYVGNHPFTNTGHHPDVPLYTVTNKNTARNKPSWWKEAQ